MKLRRKALTGACAVVVALGVGLVVNAGSPAYAHGTMMFPGNRTYLCYVDGYRQDGQIVPNNPACAQAVAQTGTTPLYNWYAVLRSDAGGRTTGYIPDGQLCSGGAGGPYDFSAYNAVRADWPVTHLTAGRTIQLRHSNWVRHPGSFQVAITKDGWNPNAPLKWSDLQDLGGVTDPPDTGGGFATNYYYWNVTLPAGKTGRHILYTRWIRSDSNENFFSCSDVVFDGGNGEVTGVGPGGSVTPPPTTPAPSTPAPTTPAPTTPAPGTGSACRATAAVTNSWSNGMQVNVTVSNTGSAALTGWTVTATLASGHTVTQSWSSTYTQSGTVATFKPATWNAALPAGGSASYGYLATTTGASAAPTVTCTSP